MTLANRIAITCTRVSFIAMGDMSIGIIARLVTDMVTFDRSVSKKKSKNILGLQTLQKAIALTDLLSMSQEATLA